ncbi:MAG: thioesterase family protein [Burkholderiales bacterium]
MNLWLRLLWLFLSARFRAPIQAPFGISVLRFRVWPHDLDLSLHMNNGRYLTLMDLGRLDLMLGVGLAGASFKAGWTPILSASKVRFRRELRPFKAFRLETRIVWWSTTQLIMEQRLISEDSRADVVHATALMLAGLYDRKKRQFVPVSQLLALAGQSQAISPEPNDEIRAFLAANDALKQAEAAR